MVLKRNGRAGGHPDSRDCGISPLRGLRKGMNVCGIGLFVLLLVSQSVAAGSTGGPATTDGGRELLREGRYQEALDMFDSVIAANPADSTARIYRGSALYSMGLTSQALLSIDIALGQNPSILQGWTTKGRILLDTGDPQGALASFERALALEPGNGAVLEGRGDALAALGRGGAARDAWKAALAADPDNTLLEGKILAAAKDTAPLLPASWPVVLILFTVTGAGLLYAGKRRTAGTIGGPCTTPGGLRIPSRQQSPTPLAGLNGGNAPANPVPGKTARKNPGALKTMSSLRKIALRRLKKDRVRTGTPGPAIADLPGEPAGTFTEATGLPDIGLCASEHAGSTDAVREVILHLDLHLGNRDDGYRGDGLAGILLWMAGENETALEKINREIGNDPSGTDNAMMRVLVLSRLGRLGEAADSADEILVSEPGNFEAWSRLASASETMGDYERAEMACTQGLSVRPNAGDLWTLRGRILTRTGKYEDALSSFRKASELNGEDESVLLGTGEVLMKMERYRDALDVLDRAGRIGGGKSLHKSLMNTCRRHLAGVREGDRMAYPGTGGSSTGPGSDETPPPAGCLPILPKRPAGNHAGADASGGRSL
ncbi:MAG: tetratricopeptide repeat protein [Methanoregulaceae archaeon]|nr:tetratricopeptide repeat protein [Methanoregulaceae archaeon]